MKKRSSLKTRMCELFPLVVSRITTPVHSPCHSQPKKDEHYQNSEPASSSPAGGIISGIKTEACLDAGVCLR